MPELLKRLARRWQLTLKPPYPGIEINYVAPVTRVDKTRCVLKVSRHINETRTEIVAMQVWDCDGAAKLLDADAESGALLLERVEPGTMRRTRSRCPPSASRTWRLLNKRPASVSIEPEYRLLDGCIRLAVLRLSFAMRTEHVGGGRPRTVSA